MLEPRLLRAFVAVAETLSFTQAAQRLGVAQQSLSLQIKRLERDLGVQLFDRSTRHVRLSDAGRRLLIDAHDVLDRLENARRNVMLAASGEIGRLAIGCGGYAADTILPAVLKRFRDIYPNVTLALYEANSAGQIEALRRGEIDAGLALLPASYDDVRAEFILEDGFSVAVAEANSPGPGALPLSYFRDARFIAGPPSQSPGLDEVRAALFQDAGFIPNVVQVASQGSTRFALVAANIGVMLSPGASSRIAQTGIVFVPVQTPRHAELSLITRRDGTSTSVLENFCEVVRRLSAERAKP